MEYIGSGNLRDWMDSNIVPPETPLFSARIARRVAMAANLALQLANGMAYLHRNRIVHRDLKPENVLVQQIDVDEVQVKVADFGLSRDIDDVSGSALTCTNGVKGTPTYMSPEQWRRGSVTDKADVYAYGLVLLELFTGCEIQWLNCECHR